MENKATCKQTQVSEMLSRLSSNIERLSSIVGRMDTRFSSVLVPCGILAERAQNEKAGVPTSQLVAQLRGFNEDMEVSLMRLDDMIERSQI